MRRFDKIVPAVLAVAAATAAFFVLRGRHGLVWPTMTLMAAMLFAMIPLRNAVPGTPIGRPSGRRGPGAGRRVPPRR